MDIKINKLAIIGVGLIGGSFARSCRKHGITSSIVGFGRGEENLKKGVELGVIDSYSLNLEDAVKDTDFVFLASPVSSIIDIAIKIGKLVKSGTILCDGGSVKKEIVEEIEKSLPSNIHFIGAHPIAGSEKGGVEESFDTLYEGAKCILTPTEKTDKKAYKKVFGIWEKIGSIIIEMGLDEHDRILGAISHLPHVAAYALVNAADKASQKEKKLFEFPAGGFRGITRIASSSPSLWSEICLMNKRNVLDLISIYKNELSLIEEKLREDDYNGLTSLFENAKKVRDGLENG